MSAAQRAVRGIVGLSWIAGLGFTACSSNVPMTDTRQVEPGETCPGGGVRVVAGRDEDGDGSLSSGEIDSSTVVCNGTPGVDGTPGADGAPGVDGSAGVDGAAGTDGTSGTDGASGSDGQSGTDGLPGEDGYASLVETTSLAIGDSRCPNGGVLVTAGIDDGAGLGTAFDGILQPGEIDDQTPLCAVGPYSSLVPPGGTPGAFIIDTSGGAGAVGFGGAGGDIDLAMRSGSGGHIKIFATGELDASFTVPPAAGELGPTPLVVDSDTLIETRAAGVHAGIAVGEAHTHTGNDLVFVWSGAFDDTVSGIGVAAGVTLTFEPQDGLTTEVSLTHDLDNAGTITTAFAADAISRTWLTITCDTFVGAPGSRIDLSGAAGGSLGGDGGNLSLEALELDWPTTQPGGAIVNQGDIDTSGGDGDDGGWGGDITLHAGSGLYSTGEVTARGGVGADGFGGDAGPITLETDFGSCAVSGLVDASGGEGTMSGGFASSVTLGILYAGDLRSAGPLAADGGEATEGCPGVCSGGTGGDIELVVGGGRILVAGGVSASGGAAAEGIGGDAGSLFLGSTPAMGWMGDLQPNGDIVISCSLTLTGGDGDDGGVGGLAQVELDAGGAPIGQEIVLLGFAYLVTGGGDGELDGGFGGNVFAVQSPSESEVGVPDGPSGGVVNYVAVQAIGGVGGDTGGDGGSYQQTTEFSFGFAGVQEVAHNFGPVDVSGGDGASLGGNAGDVWLWGYHGVENHADIHALGGTATGVGGFGGRSGYALGIRLQSDNGAVLNAADILAYGGASSDDGGAGGDGAPIEIVGRSVTTCGALASGGGDASQLDGIGGAGNQIFLLGIYEGSVCEDTTFDAEGGEAFVSGDDGEVFVDGANVTAGLP